MLRSLSPCPLRNWYSGTRVGFGIAFSHMKITEKDVLYVAELANLELSDEERPRMVRDLNSILDYMESLNEVDTTSVEPMAQVVELAEAGDGSDRSDRFEYAARDDVREGLRKSLPHEVALENAPNTDGTFFKVPKVIER